MKIKTIKIVEIPEKFTIKHSYEIDATPHSALTFELWNSEYSCQIFNIKESEIPKFLDFIRKTFTYYTKSIFSIKTIPVICYLPDNQIPNLNVTLAMTSDKVHIGFVINEKNVVYEIPQDDMLKLYHAFFT